MNDYFTDPRGYNARHRNPSEQARVDGIKLDWQARRQHPCHRHQGRHTAFTQVVTA